MTSRQLLRRLIVEMINFEPDENDPRYAEIMAKTGGDRNAVIQAASNSYLRNRDLYLTKRERDTKRDWNDRIIGKSGPNRDYLNNEVIKVHWLAGLSSLKTDQELFGRGDFLVNRIYSAIQKFLSYDNKTEQSCVGYPKGKIKYEKGGLKSPSSSNFLGAVLQGWVSLAANRDLGTQMPSYAAKQDFEKYASSGLPKRTRSDITSLAGTKNAWENDTLEQLKAIEYFDEIVVDNWRVAGFVLRTQEDVESLQECPDLSKLEKEIDVYITDKNPVRFRDMNKLIDKIENLSKEYEELSSIPTKIFGPDFNEIQVGNPAKDFINSEKFEELKKAAVEAKATIEKDFLYWVKDEDGSEIGPLDITRLHVRKRMRDLTRDTPLRVKGREGWTTAGDPTLNLGLFDDVKSQEATPTLYYIHANGKQWGSFTIDQMRSWAIDGHLKPNTSVWKTGMPGWGTASQIPELASLISSPISERSR